MKNASTLLAALFLIGTAYAVGCSSSDDGGGSKTDKDTSGASGSDAGKTSTSGTKDSGSTSSGSGADCVKAGDKGNAKGIGKYCQGTAECASGLLCTKDVGATAEEPTFCTIPCEKDADCGEGATCYEEARGKGCLPNACLPD
jgi:hypothetical protein